MNKTATAYDKEMPNAMHVQMVKHASNQQLSVIRDPLTVEKSFSVMMLMSIWQSQRMSGLSRRINSERHQAKQAEQQNTTFRLYPAMAWLLSNV